MPRHPYVLTFVAAAAGWAGGGACQTLWSPVRAMAQVRPPATLAPNHIMAREFDLVDGTDRIRGRLGIDPDGTAVLRLYDAQGRVTWTGGKTRVLPVEKMR
ncbi:MAG: hypothetical protein ABI165_01195 [Bryobacteraceae bacterium]